VNTESGHRCPFETFFLFVAYSFSPMKKNGLDLSTIKLKITHLKMHLESHESSVQTYKVTKWGGKSYFSVRVTEYKK